MFSQLLGHRPVLSPPHQGGPHKRTDPFVFVKDIACPQVLISNYSRMDGGQQWIEGWGGGGVLTNWLWE